MMGMDALMNWLPTILGTVFGGLTGLSGVLFFRKQTEESKDLDNATKKADLSERRANEWQELYEQMKRERDEAISDKKQMEYDKNCIIRSNDEKIYSLEQTNSRLKVMVAALECKKCEVYGCVNRRPPLKEQFEESDKEVQ